jgi:hypothetical protein
MQNIILVVLAILCAVYFLLSIVIAIRLKSVNPDGAFDDFGYWELVLKWPKFFGFFQNK